MSFSGSEVAPVRQSTSMGSRSRAVAPNNALLRVNGLSTAFFTKKGSEALAVDNVSFQLREGEALGVVGESGSGKSVTMLSILGLIPKRSGRVVGGEALFEGEDLLKLPERRLSDIRGNKIAMIFQDPMTSLNPVFKIGKQIAEPLIRHRGMSRKDARARAIELLDVVGIPGAAGRVDDYPHEFSGGMCQRVMIAMTLACDPKLLIADEPTTALDVTVQAQILRKLSELRHDFGMALIIVTHDLGVVAETAERVNVMYSGEIVETGSVETIFKQPRHPYTIGLLESIPRIDQTLHEGELPVIPGRPPDLANKPKGCNFYPRCAFANERGAEEPPVLLSVEGNSEHQVACWMDVASGAYRDPVH